MWSRAAFVAVVSAVLAAGCSPPSAEDLVAEVIATRNTFEVRLTSWIDRDTDTAQPWLYLDVTVMKTTEASLPRLTVLVEQVDAADNILASQRVPIDVSAMNMRGLSQSYGVEVRPMAPGVEGVRLLIEPNPARETWGEFPEFDRVRPRGQ